MDEKMEQGFDDMVEEIETAVDIPVKEEMPKRLPFSTWEVGGQTYKLKLTASAVCKLEQKYKRNLLLYITEDGLPPLSVMLTVIQAAMLQYQHKINYLTVQNLYDRYTEEGGDQTKLMSDVLMPLLGASGFFTRNQMEILTEEMKDMDSAL